MLLLERMVVRIIDCSAERVESRRNFGGSAHKGQSHAYVDDRCPPLHSPDYRRAGETRCVKACQSFFCSFRGDCRKQATTGLRIGHDVAQPFRNLFRKRHFGAKTGQVARNGAGADALLCEANGGGQQRQFPGLNDCPELRAAAYAETLLPNRGGIGRYPKEGHADRTHGWVHIDTRTAKSRWVS